MGLQLYHGRVYYIEDVLELPFPVVGPSDIYSTASKVLRTMLQPSGNDLSDQRNPTGALIFNHQIKQLHLHPTWKKVIMSPSTNASNGSVSDIIPEPAIRTLSPATRAIHADDHLNRAEDVAPAMHVSTTFRYASKPEDLVPAKDLDVIPPILLRRSSCQYLIQAPRLTHSTNTSTPATPRPTPLASKPSSPPSSTPTP